MGGSRVSASSFTGRLAVSSLPWKRVPSASSTVARTSSPSIFSTESRLSLAVSNSVVP